MPVGIGVGVAGVATAGASVYGASKSASAQKKATQSANDVQMQMFDKTQDNLSPFMNAGQNALTTLGSRPDFSFDPTQAQLASTPGYRFALGQGLKATQTGAAARGLGMSGAATKGASTFATGLADQTYGNQFDRALQTYGANTNRLMSLGQLGESAAAGVGSAAQAAGTGISNNLTGLGNAQAGAWMAGAQGVGNAFSAIPNALMTQGLYGSASRPAFTGSGSWGSANLY